MLLKKDIPCVRESSLQHNILRSFCLFFVLWRLLYSKAFYLWHHRFSVKKKLLLENKSSVVMGGALTFYKNKSKRTFSFILQMSRHSPEELFPLRKMMTSQIESFLLNSFHNMRRRQKECKITGWRLLRNRLWDPMITSRRVGTC